MSEPKPAERFADFDLSVMDQLRAHMDVFFTLIDVAVEHIDNEPKRASNLTFAAIELWQAIDRETGEIHDALYRLQKAEAAHG